MRTSPIRAAIASLALLLTVPLGAPLPAAAASLQALPSADAQIDAGSLHVLRFGHGDPVVLLPGLTTGPWEWSALIRHLAPSHTVYAVGLPGFDGRPPASAPLFDRATRDFWSLLDAQKIARPVVIGHSLGGTLAILLGEQQPERLRGIVALDGLPVFPGMETVTAEQRAALAQQSSAAIARQGHDEMAAFEKGYMRGAGGVLDDQLSDQIATLEANSDPAGTAQWLAEDLASDTRAGLAKITVPLLEIVPYNAPDLANSPAKYTEDQKVSYYRTLLNGAPKVQVVSISPARHFAMFDQPDKLNAIVDAFLSQNR
ncbi:MAG TPA: alpha/beta hydrolase [Candidatus Elarobacter sp.]|jgi:pimeloyl-ACP methyl ester carboxylesterase|nr:alpha/beta hydrolase [Candidatus Elarobacter sp.]